MILAAFSIWPLVVFAYNNPKLLLAGLATLIVLMILTWLARSWRMAILAATVAACLIWQGVEFKAGYDAREQELVELQEKILEDWKKIVADYEQQKALDDAELERLRALVGKVPENTAPALPADVARRIGDVR